MEEGKTFFNTQKRLTKTRTVKVPPEPSLFDRWLVNILLYQDSVSFFRTIKTELQKKTKETNNPRTECEGWAFRLLVRIYVLIPTFLHNI